MYKKINVVLDNNVFDDFLSLKNDTIIKLKNKYDFITTRKVKDELLNAKNSKLTNVFDLIGPQIINTGILSKTKKSLEPAGIYPPFYPVSIEDDDERAAEIIKWSSKKYNYIDLELYKLAKIEEAILLTNDSDLQKACIEGKIIVKTLDDILVL